MILTLEGPLVRLPREVYDDRPSPVHRLSSWVKVPVAIALVLGIVVLPRTAWSAYAGLGACLGLVVLWSRVSLRRLGGRLICLRIGLLE